MTRPNRSEFIACPVNKVGRFVNLSTLLRQRVGVQVSIFIFSEVCFHKPNLYLFLGIGVRFYGGQMAQTERNISVER